MPEARNPTLTAEATLIPFLQAEVKFCVTQHTDVLRDPKSLLFPDLLVLTRFIFHTKIVSLAQRSCTGDSSKLMSLSGPSEAMGLLHMQLSFLMG